MEIEETYCEAFDGLVARVCVTARDERRLRQAAYNATALPCTVFGESQGGIKQLMADEVDILIKFCEEEWTQARQSENQRATMTNYIIIIAIAIFGLMVQMDLNTKALPLAILPETTAPSPI